MTAQPYDDCVTDDALNTIRHWLNRHCGMIQQDRNQLQLQQRMERICAANGLSNLGELADRLINGLDNAIRQRVIDAAATNHTYFFREPAALDFFRDHIVGELHGRSLKVWSAAASSGDEAYSLAIVACEKLSMLAARQQIMILGTDISEPVIQQAERGVYEPHHVEHVPADLKTRYFRPANGDNVRVVDELKSLCTFRRLNLLAPVYPFQHQFDVVFCRNVLYYLDIEHQFEALQAIHKATAPNGWLITSVTESIRNLQTLWQPVRSGIYRKVS